MNAIKVEVPPTLTRPKRTGVSRQPAHTMLQSSPKYAHHIRPVFTMSARDSCVASKPRGRTRTSPYKLAGRAGAIRNS